MVWLLMVAFSGELSHCSTGGHKLLFSTLSLCKCFKVKQIKKVAQSLHASVTSIPLMKSFPWGSLLFPCPLSERHVYCTSKVASLDSLEIVTMCVLCLLWSALMCIKAGNEKRVTQRALFQSEATVRSLLMPAAAQHLRDVTNTNRCKSVSHGCFSPTPMAPAAVWVK